MELVVGSLSDQPDGGMAGVLCTLTIRTQLELRPAPDAEGGPSRFVVIAGTGAAVGEGEAMGDGLGITLHSPELSRPLELTVTAADHRGERRIVWTPARE